MIPVVFGAAAVLFGAAMASAAEEPEAFKGRGRARAKARRRGFGAVSHSMGGRGARAGAGAASSMGGRQLDMPYEWDTPSSTVMRWDRPGGIYGAEDDPAFDDEGYGLDEEEGDDEFGALSAADVKWLRNVSGWNAVASSSGIQSTPMPAHPRHKFGALIGAEAFHPLEDPSGFTRDDWFGDDDDDDDEEFGLFKRGKHGVKRVRKIKIPNTLRKLRKAFSGGKWAKVKRLSKKLQRLKWKVLGAKGHMRMRNEADAFVRYSVGAYNKQQLVDRIRSLQASDVERILDYPLPPGYGFDADDDDFGFMLFGIPFGRESRMESLENKIEKAEGRIEGLMKELEAAKDDGMKAKLAGKIARYEQKKEKWEDKLETLQDKESMGFDDDDEYGYDRLGASVAEEMFEPAWMTHDDDEFGFDDDDDDDEFGAVLTRAEMVQQGADWKDLAEDLDDDEGFGLIDDGYFPPTDPKYGTAVDAMLEQRYGGMSKCGTSSFGRMPGAHQRTAIQMGEHILS